MTVCRGMSNIIFGIAGVIMYYPSQGITSVNDRRWTKQDLNTFKDAVIDGNDGILYPGETAELIITLENIGSINSYGIDGVLSSSDDRITVIDADGYFGDIEAGEQGSNSGNTFEKLGVIICHLHFLINLDQDRWNEISLLFNFSHTYFSGCHDTDIQFKP